MLNQAFSQFNISTGENVEPPVLGRTVSPSYSTSNRIKMALELLGLSMNSFKYPLCYYLNSRSQAEQLIHHAVFRGPIPSLKRENRLSTISKERLHSRTIF